MHHRNRAHTDGNSHTTHKTAPAAANMNIDTEIMSLNGDEKENRTYYNLAKRRWIVLYVLIPSALLIGLLHGGELRPWDASSTWISSDLQSINYY
jgi:hypothetical protein